MQTKGPGEPSGRSGGRKKRGRPPEVDDQRLALVALRLFERRGVDAVTMDEVAAAAKVSRRTLFRRFPTKADLVWWGLGPVLEQTRARVAQLGARRVPLGELVELVMVPSLEPFEDAAGARWARRLLKVIAGAPSLFAHRRLDELRGVLTQAVAEHAEDSPAPAALVAETLVSVGLSSILWWARSSGGLTPLQVTRQTHAALALIGARR